MTFALEPENQLEFARPFTQVLKQILKVKNTDSTSPIAFKVKTTAPKQYCVRPNSGKIEPNGSLEVQVLLQPMKEDPPLDFKCKDKFLVQCIRINEEVMKLEGEEANNKLQEMWTAAETAKKNGDEGVIEEKKLRVVFVNDENVAANVSAVSSNIPSSPYVAPVSAIPNDTVPSSQSPPQPTTTTSSAPTTTSTESTSKADVEAQLREARETIRKLQGSCDTYLKEIERLNALRQRKTGSDDRLNANVNTAQKMQNNQEGVPLMFVLFLVALAFILGVVFF